ncbi:ABC transporter substrate-binding protein [Marinospirillum perlucidum]|uniref:ABC transporter substrate-binding protein n=1 Tax=Marinospirillum perlucidum TaxID=1982602 RepID=UPI000DF15D9A|nr:ABC transporter substrate-binding protein [Marinospirillum perlucidum]
MDKQRRTFNQLLLGAACLPLLPSLTGCQTAPPLQVASHVWPGYEFLFLARNEGWLDTRLVQLEETQSASESLEALQENRVQAATLTLDELLMGRSRGLPLKAVLIFDVSVGADQVLAKPHLHQLEDLAGKRIGAETSALGNLVLDKTLEAAGLRRDQVEIVENAASDPRAWEAGQLDALVTYEPLASRLRKEGAKVLFSSRAFPESIFDLLAVRSDLVDTYSEGLVHLMQSHFRGLEAFRTNPVDTSYRLARRLGVKGQEVIELYRGLQLPDLSANHTYLAAPAERMTLAAQELHRILLASGQVSQPINLQDLFSSQYLPRIAV